MSTQFAPSLNAAAQPIFSESSVQMHQLGTKIQTTDGRSFRYAYVGGTALVAGKLYQGPAEITNHQDLTPAAASAGATSITVTLGNTAATANYYANGYAVITVTPGVGYTYKIKSNPAASGLATMVVQLEDPINVALTTSSRVDLYPNPYSGVVVNPTTATSAPVGAAVFPVTANYYGWLQVEGPCALLADGANAVGASVVASNGVAGAVEDATGTAQAVVGTAITGCADTEYGLVQLNLA